jgi:hypothetical protein
MTPEVQDYLATYQHTQAYLKLPHAYCQYLGGIRWSSEDDALVYPDGKLFTFCAPIAEFLEGLSSGGRAIPFACVLHWAHLLKHGRNHPDADVRRLHRMFGDAGLAWRNAGALAAALSKAVPEPAQPPKLEHVCRRLCDRTFPIRWFIARFHESPVGPAEVPAIAPQEFERLVIDRLAAYADEELDSWLRHGRGPVHEAGKALARQQPPPRTLTGVLAALLLRPRLAGAETYVSRLVGALTLPPRRLVAQELPVGGYADMATHGELEHILPSQHALDELEFLRRFAERELLFFRREEPPAQNRQEIAVVIDQGVRTWGDVRLVLAAAALALGKQAAGRDQPFRVAATSNAGRLVDPLVANEEELGELIEASDLTFNPGVALEAVLEHPVDGLRDVVLLTHARNLREPDVLTAARRAGVRDRVFAVTLDEAGSAVVSEIRHGAPVTLRRFRVEFTPSKPPPAPVRQRTPWTGVVESVPFPFPFGTTADITHFEFDHDAQWLLTVCADGMLHLWGLHGQPGEVLPRPFFEDRLCKAVRFVTGVRGGFVLTLSSDSGIHIAHYDIARRRCHGWALGLSTALLTRYAPEQHMLMLVVGNSPNPPTGYAVDLANHECLTHAQTAQRPHAREAWETLGEPPTRWSSESWFGLPGLTPDEVTVGDYRIETATGTLVHGHSGQTAREFTPQSDGKPLLKGATILEAQVGGPALAVEARLRDRSHRLLIFRGSDGVLLYERTLHREDHGRPRFVLSADGRWLARDWTSRVVAIPVDGADHEVTTIHDRNADCQLQLGDHFFVLTMEGQTHCHLVRWSGAAAEFHYEHRRKANSPFRNEALRDCWTHNLMLVNTASAVGSRSYDPHRFVGAAERNGLHFALDRQGQVAVFGEGRLLCMFMASRERLAAWMPDGTWCGSPRLRAGAETPGAMAKLAKRLQEAAHVARR